MASQKIKTLGVIGDPISHSLSPLMHNAALAHLHLPYLYRHFHVRAEVLEGFFQVLPILEVVGFNVTIPHKQAVLGLIDSVSPQAKLIGACNTIVVKRGRTKGFNTDGEGYLMSLEKEAGFRIKNKNIVMIGAGGAARALAVTFGVHQAKSVTISNRTAPTAIELAKELKKHFPKTSFVGCGPSDLEKSVWEKTHLLVNATSLGMKKGNLLKLPLELLPKKALVSDIVYTPRQTDLLKKAEQLGLATHEGWGMLLYQGALAFKYFTGQEAPVDIMKKALLEELYSAATKKKKGAKKKR